MTQIPTVLVTTLMVIALSMTACRSNEPQRQTVTASDFAIQSNTTQANAPDTTQSQEQTPADQTADQTVGNAADNATKTNTSAAASSNGNADDTLHTAPDAVQVNPNIAASTNTDGEPQVLLMDAMVGQVNGKAIYASSVFEPIEPQLAALGRTLPPSVFRQRAAELIVGQLRTLVTNALILGEAERDLSKQEHFGLIAMLKSRREDLLRQLGEGSEAVADTVSVSRTGKNVDEQVDDYRQQVLVGRYISNQVRTKVNVSRKDIERYYDNHRAEYNPPPGRTIRLIMTNSQTDADHLQKMLASGKLFDEVAKSSANQYRASQGGLMADRIEGDKFSGFDELNKAMAKLKAGEHSPRLAAGGNFWWVKVETYDSGKGRSLEEAQLEIRNLLEEQQRNALGTAFRQKLLAQGSYNPVNEMGMQLLNIAMSRYSVPID